MFLQIDEENSLTDVIFHQVVAIQIFNLAPASSEGGDLCRAWVDSIAELSQDQVTLSSVLLWAKYKYKYKYGMNIVANTKPLTN